MQWLKAIGALIALPFVVAIVCACLIPVLLFDAAEQIVGALRRR